MTSVNTEIYIVVGKHGSVCLVFFFLSSFITLLSTFELLVASCNDASIIYFSGQHKEY